MTTLNIPLKRAAQTAKAQEAESPPPSNDVSLCIETVTGKLVNPANPSLDAICVDDIAWALSRIPRFAGHTVTETPYNVAQHSVYVSELVSQLLYGHVNFAHIDDGLKIIRERINFGGQVQLVAIKALFHDGHEAYFGDIPSPIKKIPALRDTFKMLETKLDEAIFKHLEVDPMSEDEKRVIKYCDKLAQAIEGYQFMPSRGLNWILPTPTLTMIQKFPAPMKPLDSYRAFLERYELLRGQ